MSLSKFFKVVGNILAEMGTIIFYRVPIGISYVFILPCLLLGIVLTFKYKHLTGGLISFVITYLLIKINKSMQGGN